MKEKEKRRNMKDKERGKKIEQCPNRKQTNARDECLSTENMRHKSERKSAGQDSLFLLKSLSLSLYHQKRDREKRRKKEKKKVRETGWKTCGLKVQGQT